MDFQGRYKNLNAAQQQAVDTIDGPVMVIAGPGTGKTELLSMRVANILRKTDTLPENILCLTYTESGVVAMRERLISVIGRDAYKVPIHTFHSFGSEVISQNRDYFYEGAAFRPADEVSSYEILRAILKSLSLKDPLSSQMNDEYTFQPDIRSVIGELKKAGLTSGELLSILDANDVTVDAAERILQPIFASTVSKKMIEPLKEAVAELRELPVDETRFEIIPLSEVVIDSLETAVDSAESETSTKPLTAWKNRFFERNKDKQLVMKARERQRKLRSVASVYDQYMSAMQKAALYDYDDMILQVVHSVEVHDDLRFNLQEKYQYLLVDEFQDTNLSQMRLLHNLTDNPVNEDKPNIFVVGDDDQAIYSFQGADVSNILNFKSTYPAAQQIVLSENYRSGQVILDAARTVITQGTERLENFDPLLSKQLSAQNPSGIVSLVETASPSDERQWLVSTIKQAIEHGVPAENIAVLTRRHSDIQQLLPYFSQHSIAVSYERRDNVLELEPIRLLEKVGRIIVALSSSQHELANALLPELLTHPAWGFASSDLWKLSTSAYDQRKRWLDTMESLPAFVEFRVWLIELLADASFTPLETMIDRIIGKPSDETPASPLYSYFFAPEKLVDDPARYITFLEGLRTLRKQLLEYHPEDTLTLVSFIEFIELHQRIGDRIQITQVFGDESAIHIMTAHSAKGLEFEQVYVIGATDTIWGHKARSRSRRIAYPENLALAPAGDSFDERLRLFYVAVTRAKQQLFVTYAVTDESNKATLPASFLLNESWQVTQVAPKKHVFELTESSEIAWYQVVAQPMKDLQTLLLPRMEQYRLSATHLNKFIDVSSGGPQAFLIDNLLHFPGARNVRASYGSAIHKTLQQAHVHFSSTGGMKPIEDILKDFETNLATYRMEKIDFDAYVQKGSDELTAYIQSRAASFSATQKPELDFAHQQSTVGDARLTGSLDLVDIDTSEKTIVVCDYKTGKPARSWTGTDEYEKIKLYKYRQQLLFYKLLVENSRDYGNYTVTSGVLEFIEPTLSGDVLTLEATFEAEEIERFKKLIDSVWKHIVTLNLPDTSAYPPTLKGILAFEQDLLDSTV